MLNSSAPQNKIFNGSYVLLIDATEYARFEEVRYRTEKDDIHDGEASVCLGAIMSRCVLNSMGVHPRTRLNVDRIPRNIREYSSDATMIPYHVIQETDLVHPHSINTIHSVLQTLTTHKMRVASFAGLVLVFFTSLSLGLNLESERTIDILAWPQSAAKPQSFASITYNSTAATVQSYHPPKLSSTEELVRLGFFPAKSTIWSGIATSSENLVDSKEKKIQLLLTSEGAVYHIGLKTRDGALTKSTRAEDDKGSLSVEVVPMKAGPNVHLNKPVVIRADGNPEGEEVEKSFLQK